MNVKGTINNISLRCVRIEILAENTKAHLGFASGSLCKFKGKIFLVTNWHVFSGKHFQTNEIVHHSGTIPGFFKIEFHAIRKPAKDIFQHDEGEINVDLYESIIENGNEIYTDNPKYLIHPIHKHEVDVAAIELTKVFQENPEINIELFDIENGLTDKPLSVMEEVFVVGFPLKTELTPNKYPIYKNATIASEPDAFEKLPLFYVDGKTKKGMSGSPVVRVNKLNITKAANNFAKVSPESTDFVGIYSGRERQEKDEYEAELGIVWRIKESLIPILENAFC